MSLRVYDLTLEVVTPVHVGTGEELPAYAYILDEATKRVHIVNPGRLLPLLTGADQQNFIRAAERPKQAQDLLAQLWARAQDRLAPAVVRTVSATPAFFNTVRRAQEVAELEFRPLPASLRGAYIPGSSLKGALRTAWLYDLVQPKLEREDLVFDGAWSFRRATSQEGGLIKPRGRPSVSMAQTLEATLLGNLREKNPSHYADPFRAVRLSDSEPLADSRLDRLGVYHPKPGHRLGRTVILAETVPAKADLRFILRYHQGLSECQGGKAPGVTGAIEPTRLMKAAFNFYGEVLDMERDFADEHRLENATAVYDQLEKRLQEDTELYPLRFGFGSGKFGTTLAFYLDDTDEPHTRKTASSSDPRGGLPLGWALAKLTAR
jgi:CRISPR-associated protein Csm5